MKFSDLLLIICGANTLKLKSLKVWHLTTFFTKYFTSVHPSIDPLSYSVPEDSLSIGNGVLNEFGGKTRSYQPMLQS